MSSKHGHKDSECFSLKIFEKLEDNITNIKNMYDSPDDLSVRYLEINNLNHTKSALIFIDGLVDKSTVEEMVIKPLQSTSNRTKTITNTTDLIEILMNELLTTSLKKATSLDEVSLSILSGDTVLFLDGYKQAIIIGTKGWKARGVEEPQTEALIRGPREGFTEDLRTNTTLLRRRIREPNLRLKSIKVGRRSKKDLTVAYVDGIVDAELVEEVNRRIKAIDTDDVPESGYIEQRIEDSFLSPFPQLQTTERPDKVSAALLQGKVALLLDVTPFVLLLFYLLS